MPLDIPLIAISWVVILGLATICWLISYAVRVIGSWIGVLIFPAVLLIGLFFAPWFTSEKEEKNFLTFCYQRAKPFALLLALKVGNPEIRSRLLIFIKLLDPSQPYSSNMKESKLVFADKEVFVEAWYTFRGTEYVAYLPYNKSASREKTDYIAIKDGAETVLKIQPGVSLIPKPAAIGVDSIVAQKQRVKKF